VWQIALAARVSKYGISLHAALWELPIAALNQIIIYDELSAGRKPRWATSAERATEDIEAMMADAMTSRTEHGQVDV
jgi:hypothetical protein